MSWSTSAVISRRRAILLAAVCAVGTSVIARYSDGWGSRSFWILVDVVLYTAVWQGSRAALAIVKFRAALAFVVVSLAVLTNGSAVEAHVLVMAWLYAVELIALRAAGDRRSKVVLSVR